MGFFDRFRGRNAESSTTNRSGNSGATELFLKAYNGDVSGVASLLLQGEDPNRRSFVNYPDSEIIAALRRCQRLVAQGHDMEYAIFHEVWGPKEPVEAMSLMLHQFNERHDNPNEYHHMELGFTPLYFPSSHGDNDVVKALIDAGADPNATIFNGSFPLYVAAESGNLDTVKLLINSGAAIDKKTPSGRTALRRAIETKQFDVVVFLIVQGADINSWTNDGSSILEAATGQLETSIAGMVYYHSSFAEEDDKPIMNKDPRLDSVMMQTLAMGMVALEEDDACEALGSDYLNNYHNELWQKAAIASIKGEELGEHEASIGGHQLYVSKELKEACSGSYGKEIASMLHNEAAIHEASYSDEPYMLYYAVRRTVDPVINRGMEKSACRDFFHQLIKNYYLVKAIATRDENLFDACMKAGADKDCDCYYRNNRFAPIVLAAGMGNYEICEQLIEAGADVNHVQSDSMTALATASMLGQTELVNMLLEHGANPDVQTNRGTALALAKNISIIFALWGEGANPNAADNDGNIPIVRFIEKQRCGAVAALMLCGSDLNHANNAGETVLDCARKVGDKKILRILEDKCAHDAPYPEINLGAMRAIIVERIMNLTLLKYPLHCFFPLEAEGDHRGQASSTQLDSANSASHLFEKAVDSKKSGDLISANALFLEAAEYENVFIADHALGWFKVLLLAKNFRDAQIVLRYYHAIIASKNALLSSEGMSHNIDSNIDECFLSQRVNLFNVLVNSMDVWPRFHSSVNRQIREFGESDYWDSFYLTDNEYDLFLRYLVEQDMYNAPFADEDDIQMAVLEEAVLAGDTKAFGFLARLLIDEDRNRAISLCEKGFAAGDFFFAPIILAVLLKSNDPSRASDIFEFEAKYNGDASAARELVSIVEESDPERAIPYLELLVRAGDVRSYSKLARLIYEDDKKRAIGLCEEAISLRDDDDAPFFLAWLLADDNPERAKELYQSCVDRGYVYGAAHNLAKLIEEEDPERAKELYELSLEAGNEYAGQGLADLLWDSDPSRAKELYRKAIDEGDEYEATYKLALLIEDEDPDQAKQLYERSIAAGDKYASPRCLAELLEKDDPERAASLYRIAIEEGNTHACTKLAWLIYGSDRSSAIELCEKALAAKEDADAAFLLGFLLERENVERSKELYEFCLAEGSYVYGASCNLASLISRTDPERAIELYELAINEGNTLAYSRLARLVSASDRKRAIELCEQAIAKGDTNDAPFFLAWLLEKEDLGRSKELYQLCVDNGYCNGAANNLANLIKAEEPERAKELFGLAIEAGNHYYAAANLATMLHESDPDKAAELYQKSIDAGNVSSYAKLARLVSTSDKNRAIELCEKAVKAGDTFDGPFFLAWLNEGKDPNRCKELYQLCIDNGNVFHAANNLGNLIKAEDPSRARELFEISLEAGNHYYAAVNLADMLTDEDPNRAAELYQMAIDAGNITGYTKLARLISAKDKTHAIELCEKAVEAGDIRDGAFYLAWLLEDSDTERSKELYQTCVDNDYCFGAAYNLACLVKGDDPARAIALFNQSANAGRAEAFNEAGVLAMKRSAVVAADYFNKGMNAGEKTYAPCNLGHMLLLDDPIRAEELYRLSLDNETKEEATESLIGLSLMLESKSPEESSEYRAKAIARSNLQASLDFMAEYFDAVNSDFAKRVRSFAD